MENESVFRESWHLYLFGHFLVVLESWVQIASTFTLMFFKKGQKCALSSVNKEL